MEFPEFDFDKLNEADVREEIIAPLLKELGYRSSTENDIIREQQLSYPKLSLGRQKSTDPFLRGKADYICVAANKIRWVIEAKSPSEDINGSTQEQAWSYANHPEIRAVYYAVSNGRKFKIWQTNQGHEQTPILECDYAELPEKLTIIKNVLSPSSILRDHPPREIDTGKPIGPGLRSLVRIASGQISYLKMTPDFPPMTQIIMTIQDGFVERNPSGGLTAYLNSLMPIQILQKLNEDLGLDKMELHSVSEEVSCSALNPTLFTGGRVVLLPKGMRSVNILDWSIVELPMNFTVNVETEAKGYLSGSEFKGTFNALLHYREINLQIALEGEYSLYLT